MYKYWNRIFKVLQTASQFKNFAINFFRRWHRHLIYPLRLATEPHFRKHSRKHHRKTMASIEWYRFHRSRPSSRGWCKASGQHFSMSSTDIFGPNWTTLVLCHHYQKKNLKLWPTYGQNWGWYHQELNNFAGQNPGWQVLFKRFYQAKGDNG